jgi:hypothetical protein
MNSPRIYTYKVTFPSQRWWYWGVHKERKYGEPYSGSPKTHKGKWDLFYHEVQILEFFDSWDEARAVEKRLIAADLNNPNCLNENNVGSFSIEASKKGARIGAAKGGKLGGSLPWWNNGSQNTRATDCPGPGWVRGSLMTWHWWTDGSNNVRSKDRPEGFVPGRITTGLFGDLSVNGRKGGSRSKPPKNRPEMKGRKWFNDGKEEFLAHNQPDGAIPGRIIAKA